MTDLIEQLRKLEGKTTEGPWACESDGKTWWVDTGGKQVCEVCTGEQDATLISLAPSMAKKLLAAEEAIRTAEKADEYLTKLQAPGTEPLNSVNASTSKADRSHFTAQVRNEAREVWAALGNALAAYRDT